MPWFYPDPVFGWTFYAVLLGFLGVATCIDIVRLRIPNKLLLVMLAVGLLFSLVRGAWMGAILDGRPGFAVWHFGNSPVLGALDGFVCALEGFLVAFVLYFVLWVMGVLGGADVKLMAALGAWVGPVLILGVALGTGAVVLVLGPVMLLLKLRRHGVQKTMFSLPKALRGQNAKRKGAPKKEPSHLLAYSLPVAISAGVVLGLLVVHDWKNPVPPKEDPPAERAAAQP